MGHLFHQIDKEHTGQIGSKQLKEHFLILFGSERAEDAGRYAQCLLAHGDKYRPPETPDERLIGYGKPYEDSSVKRKGYLTFAEFLQVMTEDNIDHDFVRTQLEENGVGTSTSSNTGAGSSKNRYGKLKNRLPPPYQMWEQVVDRSGRPFFQNHDTRETSWDDPRKADMRRGGV